MKEVLFGSLLVTGLLFAQDQAKVNKVSGNERQALASQSPRVHVAKRHRHHKNGNTNAKTDRVVTDKKTVNAYVPEGK
jgi:outer membrane murein-binding lipoprotein Lpp